MDGRTERRSEGRKDGCSEDRERTGRVNKRKKRKWMNEEGLNAFIKTSDPRDSASISKLDLTLLYPD